MTYNLFLDDERDPPRDNREWIIARTFEEAVEIVTQSGLPGFVSFDHDLGLGKTGMDFARWFGDFVLDHDLSLSDFAFYVHSQNPVGRVNIESYMLALKRECR